MYSNIGRPSIAPEKLLRALLLQVLYTIRSERMLMEQLEYNLLFRWFVGLNMDEAVWDPTVFTKNRDRLLEAEWPRSSSAWCWTSQGTGLAIGRALHGGRDADGSLGESEEFQDGRRPRIRRRRMIPAIRR